LAQRVLEGNVPAVGVEPHFALRHDAVFVLVHELHRVFDGHDVLVRVLVAPVHHGGQRGRFARAGAAHQDADAAFGQRQVFEHLRQPQAVDGRDFGRNGAHHQPDLAHLHEGVDAKAPNASGGNGEIALHGAFELGRLLVVHERARQRLRVLARKRLRRDLGDLAIDLDRRREVGGEKQIAAVAAHQQAQQVVDELAGLIAFHGGLFGGD